MKIGIIGTHSFPIPSQKTHAGDHFYALLARTLDEMGHQVSFFAPEGSYVPPHGQLYPILSSGGHAQPTSLQCEQECFQHYHNILQNQDIIHDFSITKQVVELLCQNGFKKVLCSPQGGIFAGPNPIINFTVSSFAMQDRWSRGATDYENTPFPEFGGANGQPIRNTRVVYYGIDTDFYYPTYQKQNYFLWLGRWHQIRGYALAIEIAKRTQIELVMVGRDPNQEIFDYQKQCGLEAIELAKGHGNIHFHFLPEGENHHIAKRDWMQAAKGYLCTTQFAEPFGLTNPEVLSCGTPIVSTNYGSMPEIIQHRLTGYIADNSIEDFADGIEYIQQIDPRKCREEAVKRFDRHVMAINYLEQYIAVIRGESW